jgi:predicted metalloprotease
VAARAVLVVAAALLAGCATEAGIVATRAEPAGTDTPTVTAPGAPTAPGTPDSAPPASTVADPVDTLPPPTVDPAPTTTIDRTPGDVISIEDVVDVGTGRTPRPYDDLVAAALADLAAWWSRELPAAYGIDFVPLAGGVVAAYPDREEPLPGCGSPRTSYPEINEYAAFYCPFGDFMLYDDGDDSLLGALAAEFGPAVMGVVLAHEYGHAVQQRIGALDRELATIVTEQQADCFAGAWVAHARSGDSPYLRLDDTDVRSALIAMVTVRDPVGIDQFAEGGHGSAFDRVGAFQEGFAGGVARCARLLDEPLPLMPNTFRSDADLVNDGDLPFGFDDGDIAPLIVESLQAYWGHQLGELGLTFAAPSLVPEPDAAAVACGSRPLVVGLVVCPTDGTVHVDEAFARQLYDDPIEGRADFAVGYLIGTGWADAVQEQLGSVLTGEARALANDCLVGAWSRDLFPRELRPGESEERPGISPGDLDEAVLAAITIGDPAFEDDRIGSAFEKIDAFRDGVLGGFDACAGLLGP